MKEDKVMTALGVLTAALGVLMLSVGRFIAGAIVLLLAFGIFWNRGGGKRSDRVIYEKIVKTGLDIRSIYERIKDIETPLGRAWIAGHKGYAGKSIIFGPGKFKDCVVISRDKNGIDIKHITKLENIIRSEDDDHRFEELVNTQEAAVTPERYSIFCGFKLASVMMVRHLAELIQGISDGSVSEMPESMDLFKFYYHNSSDGHFRNSEGEEVMKVAYSYVPFESKVSDEDGSELASVMPRAFNRKGIIIDSKGYELFANGEHYGEIRRFRDKSGEGFICETSDEVFTVTIFPACLRANISCNFMVEKQGELKAVIGGSPNIVFDKEGSCRNEVILSYDDDYLVLYAVLEVFILTLNSRFLK